MCTRIAAEQLLYAGAPASHRYDCTVFPPFFRPFLRVQSLPRPHAHSPLLSLVSFPFPDLWTMTIDTTLATASVQPSCYYYYKILTLSYAFGAVLMRIFIRSDIILTDSVGMYLSYLFAHREKGINLESSVFLPLFAARHSRPVYHYPQYLCQRCTFVDICYV